MLDHLQFKYVLAIVGALGAMLISTLSGGRVQQIVLAPIGGVPFALYIAYVVVRHHKLPMTATWGEVSTASRPTQG
jgi:hypothetical protein